MRDKRGVCRECCCERANDASQYEVCDGEWSPASEGVRTSSSDAKLLFVPALAPGQPWRVRCTVKVFCAAGATWELRICGGAVDCDDDGAFLIWGQDAAGEYFDLHGSIAPFDTSCGEPGRTKEYVFALCWDGAQLSATGDVVGGFGTQTSFDGLLVSKQFSPAGTRAGFATGTLSGVSSIQFYDFHLEYTETDQRPACPVCSPVHCALGSIPPSLALELAVDAQLFRLDLSGGGGECDGECFGATGTFFLAAPPCNGSLQGSCTWSHLLFPFYGPCAVFFVPPMLYEIRLAAWIEYAGTFGEIRRVRVTVTSVGNGFYFRTLLDLYADTDLACEDWTGWINLSVLSSGACGATLARIKKA